MRIVAVWLGSSLPAYTTVIAGMVCCVHLQASRVIVTCAHGLQSSYSPGSTLGAGHHPALRVRMGEYPGEALAGELLLHTWLWAA